MIGCLNMMASSTSAISLVVWSLVLTWAPRYYASAECLANSTLNNDFVALAGGPIPVSGSCCMFNVCGLACPTTVTPPANGFGIAVAVTAAISFAIGVSTFFMVKGKSANFFVAGRSLPMWMVAVTLVAASIDSNALLGNVDLSYRYSLYDGMVIPIGLGLSLILNGLFLAKHINNDQVLTLVDVFAKRYGVVVEVLVSLITCTSFIMLLAGNLLGFGVITSYLWGISEQAAIWIAASIIWVYTAVGGLYSVAYTDLVQAVAGFSGCIVMAYWFIANEENLAPPPSIGFPGYIYPDSFGDGGPCDMYQGVNCTYVAGKCCYNTEIWCPGFDGTNPEICERYDRGAYPAGDQAVYPDQMTNAYALSPFPNSIFWNWATIFILGFGNLAALDFQGRCMAAKAPWAARWGCLIAGCVTIFIGVPFSYMGSMIRYYYGPDATNSEFDADTCHLALNLPTCAAWVPNGQAFMMLMTHQAPPVLGAWCMMGIIAASMSTGSGAVLAMGTVMAHNVVRQLDRWWPNLVTADNLLQAARFTTLPFALASTLIAGYYRSSSNTGGTGYLLIVAFDIVLATVVVPLFGCFYAANPSPRAALCTIVVGLLVRVILEFTLPKDGYLLLPFGGDEFLDYGPAASSLFPSFIDVNQTLWWNPETEPCEQTRFSDFTGVDSLSAFLAGLIAFLSIQYIEFVRGTPIFQFGGMEGYVKDTTEHPLKHDGTGSSARKLEETEQDVDPTSNENEADAKGENGAEPVSDDSSMKEIEA